MSITRSNPNTVFLGGDRTQVNDLAAEEALTPGMLIERHSSAGVVRWRKHATSGGNTSVTLATEMQMMNKGVDDAYAIADLVEASVLHKGASAWGLIGSNTVVAGDQLESAGNGLFQKKTSGTAIAVALEAKTNTSGTARLRLEAL